MKFNITVVIILLILLIVVAFSCTDDKEELNKNNNDKVPEVVQEVSKGDEEVKGEATKEEAKVETKEEAKEVAKGETSKKEETVTKPSGNSGNTVNKPSAKPSTSNTTSKPSTETKPSNNTTVTKPEPQKPVHTHSWEPVYEEVVGGYYETVIDYEAYEMCNHCKADISGDPGSHVYNHIVNGVSPSELSVSTQYREIESQVWVPVTENVIVGYKCSCGAMK